MDDEGDLAQITLTVNSSGEAHSTFDFAESLTSEQVVGIASVLQQMSEDCFEFLEQATPITQH